MTIFTISKAVGLLAIIFGIAGTWLIYKGSSGGSGLGAYVNQALIDEVRRVGKYKQNQQIIGLIFMLISFAFQAAILFLPTSPETLG